MESDLSSALRQFDLATSRDDRLVALSKLDDCIGVCGTLSVSREYLVRRKADEFVKTISDKTIKQICCFLLKDETKPENLKDILRILYIISSDIDKDKQRLGRHTGLLMENGAFVALLTKIDELQFNDDQCTWTIGVLKSFVLLDFTTTNTYERSIPHQAYVFSKLPMLVNVANQVQGKVQATSIAANLVIMFSSFLMTIGTDYCRAMVRSQLEDGTVLKISKLFVRHSANEKFLKSTFPLIILALPYVAKCDLNTVYNMPNRGIYKELRTLVPTLLNNLPLIYKEGNAFVDKTVRQDVCLAALKLLDYFAVCSNTLDHQLREKVVKKVVQFLLYEIRSKRIDPERVSLLLTLLINKMSLLDDFDVEDIHPVFPYLSKLMDIPKYPQNSETNPMPLLCAKFLTGAVLSPSMKEKHLNEVLNLDVIPFWIDIFKSYYYTGNHRGQIMFVNIFIGIHSVLSKTPLISCLNLIDQLLLGFPLYIDYLTKEKNHLSNDDSQTQWIITDGICQTFLAVTFKLIRISDDNLGCIDSRLKVLTECNFVSGIGKAIAVAKAPKTLYDLLNVIVNLCIVADNSEMMKSLAEFLPDITDNLSEIFAQLRSKGDDDYIGLAHQEQHGYDNFSLKSQLECLLRKAVAYAIDDIDPLLIAEGVAPRIFREFVVDENIMRFAVPETCDKGSDYCYPEDATGDILRATWCICNKYPMVTYAELKKLGMWNFTDPRLMCLKMLRAVVDTIISYLDQSQDYSLPMLKVITAFVGDLSDEVVDCKEKEVMFRDLLAACHRFLEVQSHKVLVKNVNRFVNCMQNV